jgi:ankyrin repeat protein
MDTEEIIDVFGFGEITEVNNFLILSPDFSIDTIIYMGQTPLGIAARFSNYKVVSYLISLGADVNKYDSDCGGEPPVKVAFDQKDLKMYEVLRSFGADLTLPGWMGVSVEDRLKHL